MVGVLSKRSKSLTERDYKPSETETVNEDYGN